MSYLKWKYSREAVSMGGYECGRGASAGGCGSERVEVKDRFECWRVRVWEGTSVGGMRSAAG